MAILRGGKRIGGMDIRIGIPRDRSMDNINRDPRFKLKAGANPATNPTAGTANTGGGGGGGDGPLTSSAGGSGVVILRYRKA